MVYIYYSLTRGGHTWQKYRNINGRCIAILFKSIRVRGQSDSPEPFFVLSDMLHIPRKRHKCSFSADCFRKWDSCVTKNEQLQGRCTVESAKKKLIPYYHARGNKYISNSRPIVDAYVPSLNSNSLTKRILNVCVFISVARNYYGAQNCSRMCMCIEFVIQFLKKESENRAILVQLCTRDRSKATSLLTIGSLLLAIDLLCLQLCFLTLPALHPVGQRRHLRGRALYGPMPVKTDTFREL